MVNFPWIIFKFIPLAILRILLIILEWIPEIFSPIFAGGSMDSSTGDSVCMDGIRNKLAELKEFYTIEEDTGILRRFGTQSIRNTVDIQSRSPA
jgi:hypothetical protein